MGVGLVFVRRNDDLATLAQVEAYEQVTATVRFNNVGTIELTGVRLGSAAGQELLPDDVAGRGVLVDRGDGIVVSGPVLDARYRENAGVGVVVDVTAGTDEQWLRDRLALPFGADTDVRTGPAESVMTSYVDVNAAVGAGAQRAVPLLTVGPDLARGVTVTGRARYHRLDELLRSLAIPGGDLGFRVRSDPGALVFEVYEPRDLTATVVFAASLGTLRSADYSSRRPVANHVYAGGSGDGAARVTADSGDFVSVDAWGRVESFLDESTATTAAMLAQPISEELARNASSSALEAVPQDTQSLRAGDDWWMGDKVTVVVGGSDVAALVREVSMRWGQDGEVITPLIGSPGQGVPSPIAGLYRRLRRLDEQLGRVKAR